MKVLFARIGFMKFYKGPKPGDEKPVGGGSYNSTEVGHEAYNFLSIDGHRYGYFQPHMTPPYDINIKRIDPNCDADQIDNVLVIWFATNPIAKGQVVVGWYKNATVFRSIQSPTSLPQRGNYNYNIIAKAKDCTLLPISKRKYPVGHDTASTKEGNPGQANAFYTLDEKGQEKDIKDTKNAWIKDLLAYVEAYEGPEISSQEDEDQEDILTSVQSSGGQGFQSNVETRLMIEAHAMSTCMNYYISEGYVVEDVSATKSYDLLITKNGRSHFVEVKGTQTAGGSIILTKNEVQLSKSHGGNMILFVVHSIAMNKKTVKKGSGIISIIKPWQIDEERLTPISFTYRLQ